jgi:polyol permease family
MSPIETPTAGGGFAALLERQGIQRSLAWGFLAVTLFMIGDGIELGFLSPYLATRGFTTAQVATLISLYGIVVAVAAWFAGALAEAWGPRRVMLIGFAFWATLEVVFLIAIMIGNFPLMLISYGVRGIGYPFFSYGFLVWVTMDTPEKTMGRAVGWFWFANTTGLGVISSYLAALTIPLIGQLGTMWLSWGFVIAGGLIVALLMRSRGRAKAGMTTRDALAGVARSLTILKSHPKVGVGGMVRLINTLSFYAFGVFLTYHMVKVIGFSTPIWQSIWGTMLLANVIGNLLFGYVGDKLGRVNTVAWFGGIGCAVSCLLLYYVPAHYGANYALVLTVSIVYGLFLAAFVPLSAIVPLLAPQNKAAAVAVLNLGAGLSNAAGPLLTRIFQDSLGGKGLMWMFAIIYVGGFFLTFFLRPGKQEVEEERAAETAIGLGDDGSPITPNATSLIPGQSSDA